MQVYGHLHGSHTFHSVAAALHWLIGLVDKRLVHGILPYGFPQGTGGCHVFSVVRTLQLMYKTGRDKFSHTIQRLIFIFSILLPCTWSVSFHDYSWIFHELLMNEKVP
jgi:hypothetical protein